MSGSSEDEPREALAARLQEVAGRLADEGEEVSKLGEASEGRDVVGRATGMLMERYKLDTDTALSLLRSISADTDRTLGVVASVLVETGQENES